MKPKYVRMVKRMKEKEKTVKKKSHEPWFVYILRCSNGALYTGVTKDLEHRLKMHNAGKASRYTRARRPVELLYYEQCKGRAQALMREYQVKQFPKAKKESMVMAQA